MDFCEIARFVHHAVGIHADNLSGNRTVYDGGDFRDNFLEVAPFFCNQARIRRNAADDAKFVCFADMRNVCSINKQFQTQDFLFHNIEISSTEDTVLACGRCRFLL